MCMAFPLRSGLTYRAKRSWPLRRLRQFQLAQREALELAGFGARQALHELDRARIFVRCDRSLHEFLQLVRHGGISDVTRLQRDKRLHDLATLLVGRAYHATFGDRRMQQEHVFDFRTGDVIAGAYDHVVGARPVDEIAVFVDRVRVASVVPASLDVIFLAPAAGSGWPASSSTQAW